MTANVKTSSKFQSESLEASTIRTGRPLRFGEVAKRSFDVAAAMMLLALCLPVMAILAAVVAMDGGPVLYRHRRVGRDMAAFDCLKLRTMMPGAESSLAEYLSYHPAAAAQWASDRKLDFDPRVTPVGRFLRATSLDELPQLINVLAGHMSLVGPRPVTPEETLRYGENIGLYASVRPGITGPWQVGGRSDVGYVERVSQDVRYARERTFAMDMLILLATPRAVLSRRGAR